MRVAMTGASGLIGSALARSMDRDGIEVIRLVRRAPASAAEVRWDPDAAAGAIDSASLTGLDAVVHLSGAPIASGRWTAARKLQLRASRIGTTSAVVAAMLAAYRPPPVLLVASAIGWYGDTGQRQVDETAPNGTGFLAELVRDWEAAAQPAVQAGIRVVHLRSGVVLSRRGGMIGQLLLPFRLGLGARLGSGSQYLSWISLADHVRASRFMLDAQEHSGPVNLTAPVPATNAEFTAALASALHRPALFSLPAGLLRAALGEVAGELLASYRVEPARLNQAGFSFQYPQIGPAMSATLADPASQ